MKKGTIKFFRGTLGYGFVIDITTGDEFFVHATTVKSSGILVPLREGDVVFFDVAPGRDGRPQVSKVERA